MLTDAVEHDLDAESQRAAAGEERLAKIEGQLRALSDAIIVKAALADAVDGTVQTVEDKK